MQHRICKRKRVKAEATRYKSPVDQLLASQQAVAAQQAVTQSPNGSNSRVLGVQASNSGSLSEQQSRPAQVFSEAQGTGLELPIPEAQVSSSLMPPVSSSPLPPVEVSSTQGIHRPPSVPDVVPSISTALPPPVVVSSFLLRKEIIDHCQPKMW